MAEGRFRVLVTGSRDWDDEETIAVQLRQVFAEHGSSVTLVSGGARGADALCEALAARAGWSLEVHPADWSGFGRAAGPLRNAAMVSLGADLCLAFIKDGSAGASGCAALAEKAGIATLRVYQPPREQLSGYQARS